MSEVVILYASSQNCHSLIGYDNNLDEQIMIRIETDEILWNILDNEILIISSNWMSLELIAGGKIYGKGIDTYYCQNVQDN